MSLTLISLFSHSQFNLNSVAISPFLNKSISIFNSLATSFGILIFDICKIGSIFKAVNIFAVYFIISAILS